MKTRTTAVAALGVLALVLAIGGCVGDGEPIEAPATQPTLTASPSGVFLVGTLGKPGPDALVSIECSDVTANHRWRAARDVRWLDLVPSDGGFDLGFADLSLRVSTDGLDVGTYVATVSLTIDGFEGVLATIPVTVEMQAPEDPEIVAVRTFWESSNYQSYWSSKAPGDVRSALLDYTFPEYGLGQVEEIHVKSIDFDYVPELYARPIARALCEVSFIVWDELTGADWEEDRRQFTRYWGDVVVVLEVEPGPYSTANHGWSVVELPDYTTLSASASASSASDDVSSDDESGCGC